MLHTNSISWRFCFSLVMSGELSGSRLRFVLDSLLNSSCDILVVCFVRNSSDRIICILAMASSMSLSRSSWFTCDSSDCVVTEHWGTGRFALTLLQLRRHMNTTKRSPPMTMVSAGSVITKIFKYDSMPGQITIRLCWALRRS
ncbi:hypothetical protein M758_10G128500 [Ceratodon purpureus]|nr:hypothetical protein M758_10G128500 [Ceratodon purpureus]